jgi:hypothetical protein
MRSVCDFGAVGDGECDDTEAIQHAVAQGLGAVYFPPGTYRITRSVVVTLAEDRRLSLHGAGGTAKIIMAGAGPAFRVTGTHTGTASPASFTPGVWADERMPTFLNLEIEGAHPEADGILIEGTMQSLFEGVLLRELRHGIHLRGRNRNVLISHCHVYHNRGVGIYCDHVNLHQFNVVGSHISYNAQSGIKLLNGEIRNFQFTGNDIEYNHVGGAEAPEPSAEIWVEATGEKATIREGTISGNTIQSVYSPGGANIRIEGLGPGDPNQAGMIAISGNLIGSQEVNLRLAACRAVTVTGNVVYSGHLRNIHATDCRNLVVTGNSIDHNPGYLPRELTTCVTFTRCHDSSFTGSVLQEAEAGAHTVETPATMARKGLLELLDCRRFAVQGCQILDAAEAGIYLEKGAQVLLSGCTITGQHETPRMDCAIRWEGPGEGNAILGNLLGPGRNGHTQIAAEAQVHVASNVEL